MFAKDFKRTIRTAVDDKHDFQRISGTRAASASSSRKGEEGSLGTGSANPLTRGHQQSTLTVKALQTPRKSEKVASD
jgi:hypothetical protein